MTLSLDDLPRQVIGNLLVFVALGFFLPMRWSRFASIGRVLAVAAMGSLVAQAARGRQHIRRIEPALKVAAVSQ